MHKLIDRIRHALSVRISLKVVCAIAVLLFAAISFVLYYSYKSMREDALSNARETLEYTVESIDNVLLSVEQTAGNVYWDLLFHLDDPDRMHTYCRELLQSNRYVMGCAIAMEPDYFKDRGRLFMAYYYRTGLSPDATIVQSDTFNDGPYEEQEWFTRPMSTGRPCWIDPLKDADALNEAITTFSLPIYNHEGRVVGVLGVDVSTLLLSSIIQAAKPTPNSYALLMGNSGSFVVYPDVNLLLHQGEIAYSFEHADESVREAIQAMDAGETGYRRVRFADGNSYLFFKPFTRTPVLGRSEHELNWSAGVVLPEADIFGDFIHMRFIVILGVALGLLLIFVFCTIVLHKQLEPLRLLTRSAQHIADGHYDGAIPDSHQQDEVGKLQSHFKTMQHSLSDRMGELQHLSISLRERGEELENAYKQAKEAEQLKTAVLHNMSNQMLPPVNVISSSVDLLCKSGSSVDDRVALQLANEIDRQGKTVTRLLDQLLIVSQKFSYNSEK